MRKIITALIFLLVFYVSYSQCMDKYVIKPDLLNEKQLIKFDKMITNLKQKKYKDSISLVMDIFFQAKLNFLTEYDINVPLDEVLNNRRYNCVSGTLFLSIIYNEFNIKTQIVETSNHVFMFAFVNNKIFLIESTSLNPFIKEIKSISRMENDFIKTGQLLIKISIENLIGLQYYNESLKYIGKDNVLAMDFIYNGIKYYPASSKLFYMKRIVGSGKKFKVV